mgnify:CR=1 FL=1
MTDLDLPDGTYTAVVDTVEEGLVTLIFDRSDEGASGCVVNATNLPVDARHQDAVLTVTVDDGDFVDYEYDPEATDTRQREAQDRFDRLSQRPPEEDDEG